VGRLLNSLKAGLAASALLIAQTMSASAGSVPESTDTIKLALNEWSGQHITTKVAGEILTRMGYKVEYVTAGYVPQLIALGEGKLSAALEIWLSNIGDNWPNAKATGKVIEIGPLGLAAREGWAYPEHMKEICPGLPDWKALQSDKCKAALATAETLPDGRILDYPPDWGQHSGRMIKGLGLPFQAVPAGSEGALVSELKASVLKKTPLIAMFWTPHWLHNEMKIEFLDLPAYDAACLDNPSWGVNPNEAGDCGLPVTEIIKIAWVGFEGKWPAAFRFLKNYTMNVDDQIAMMFAVDVEGRKLDTVVKEWVEKNEAKWQPWVKTALQE